MFPPNSLICSVTIASPSQTIVNTPENTNDDCSSLARIDKNMLRSKQKISGPLEASQRQLPISNIRGKSLTRKRGGSKRARHTKDPNPSAPHSCPLAKPHQHRATSRQCLSTRLQIQKDHQLRNLHHAPQPQCLHPRAVKSHPSGTSAIAPGAFSPRRRTGRVRGSATRSHRWCSVSRDGLHRGSTT